MEEGDGLVSVEAGPGSGKTRVIVARVLHLLQRCGVPAGRILALTFSSKAATEMAQRVRAALAGGGGGGGGGLPRICTFHSLCAWLLHTHGTAVGVATDYSVMSEAAQLQLVRSCLAQVAPQAGSLDPRAVLRALRDAEAEVKAAVKAEAKAAGKGAGAVEGEGEGELRALATAVAPLYDAACRDAVSGLRVKLDFESMLRLGLRLLRETAHGASYAEM